FLVVTSFGGGGAGRKASIDLPEDYWYFGYVPTNVIVKHDYWIRNSGVDTLRIDKIVSHCDCTSVSLEKNAIAARDSARLEVIFDTANLRGKVIKKIDIIANDPDQPQTSIRLFARVKSQHPTITVTPETVSFPRVTIRNLKSKESVTVWNNSESDIELKIIDPPHPPFNARLARNHLRSGASTKIDVRLTQIPEKAGIINSSLTVEFTAEETERITIPITALYQAE
ncbi:MAG: DUF1573 domain-containing protein, partial [candidate division Zixibacteria bacterium]|nr:DUF1573 domain-containing protein [candidate division Zixibacteria bacterium]